MELKHCSITIPKLPQKTDYSGCFSVENERLQIWLLWDEHTDFEELFKLSKENSLFSVIIQTSNVFKEVYSCFNCFFASPIIPVFVQETDKNYKKLEPWSRERLIELRCNSWIEHCRLSSLDEPKWNKVSFTVPFSEPWFLDHKESVEVTLSESEILHFQTGEREQYKAFPISHLTELKGQIVYEKRNGSFSINDAMNIGLKLQCLMRYSSKIAFPPVAVNFLEDDEFGPIQFGFHGSYGLHGISEYATSNKYVAQPFTLAKLLEKDVIKKWFEVFSNKDLFSAMLNYCKMQNIGTINECIIEQVKVFDKLSDINDFAGLGQEQFLSWVTKVAQYGIHESNSAVAGDRIKGVLVSLSKKSLKQRLTEALQPMYPNPIEKETDIKSIAKYLCNLRHADSHSGYADIESLPSGYDYWNVLEIIDNANRNIVDSMLLQ